MKLLRIASALSVALLSSNVVAAGAPVEFYGYMRGGVGLSNEGGANSKWEVNKVGRLGNENDLYGEIGLKKEVYAEDGTFFVVDSMVKYWEGQDANSVDRPFEMAQFNVQATGLFDDKDITIWAGDRYYQRHDVHIVDNYYWDVSGIGGGVEHINLGPGKLSVALLQDTLAGDLEDGQETTAVIADVRYAGIPLWSDADLEVGIDYHAGVERADQELEADNSLMFTASLNQNLDSGLNKTIIQLGSAGYAKQMTTFGQGNGLVRDSANDDAKGYRVINWGVMSLSDDFEFGHSIRYAAASDVDGTDTDDSSLSVVVRPVYKWTEKMRTVLEVGGFTETLNDVDGAGSKLTIAQAWVPKAGFWSRPEIRIFATYVNDSENDDAFGIGKDSEISVGMQAEAWW